MSSANVNLLPRTSSDAAVQLTTEPTAETQPTSAAVPRAVTNPLILIVDDEEINIKVTAKYLRQAGYDNFVTTFDDANAFTLIQRVLPDIILLDVMMPNVSGLEILQQVRRASGLSQTPTLILTASTDRELKVKALQAGATDFLAKPVDPSELVARVRNALVVKAHQDHLARYAVRLEEEVRLRTAELALSRKEIISCLARAAEYRDENTGHHILRVGKYAAAIATALDLSPNHVEMIEQAAQLHDVGKIGIPDHILHKGGPLTEAEYGQMQEHCAYGQMILQRMSEAEFQEFRNKKADGTVPIIKSRSSQIVELAAKVALTHHEWWDGTGYPNGLKGDQIPIEGRITSLADVFDALSSSRPYKQAFDPKVCIQMIMKKRGTQFDPGVVDAMMRVLPQFRDIMLNYND